MTIEDLEALWLNAPSSPWKALRGGAGDAYGIGNDQTRYSSINMEAAVPYILALNDLAPELIALWRAVNATRFGDGLSATVLKALAKLNAKAEARKGGPP